MKAPEDTGSPQEADITAGEGCELVSAPMTASVFQIAVQPGQKVAAGERLIVLDAMKTEIVVAAPSAGVVEEVRCVSGKLVHAGQPLIILRIV